MCGRYTLGTPEDVLRDLFEVEAIPEPGPRYNIAPTQKVLAVRAAHSGGGREAVLLQWGLVPPWADDRRIGSRMINARSETVAVKPSFRGPYRKRRCLVPADGFYEWRRTKGGKRPVHVRVSDVRAFAFAGLWETWCGPGDTVIESCTILTTTANERVAPVHDRMPVILHRQDHDLWLDRSVQGGERLAALLVPFPAERTEIRPVGTRVNDVRNDDPLCLEPEAQGP